MPKIEYRNKEGESVPGVTTVIGGSLGWNKNQLMWWSWNEGMEGRNYRDTSGKAADAGTMAHQMVELNLKGEPDPLAIFYKEDDDIWNKASTAYLAWLDWKELVDFKLLGSELSLVSEEWNYGGTIDIAAIKQVPSIIDIKTSNKGPYPDHLIQVAAYGKIYEECYPGTKIGAYYILRLDKNTGGFSYHYYPQLDDAWEAFKCLLKLHELKKIIK